MGSTSQITQPQTLIYPSVNRTLVIMGSSVAYGQGATVPANSWAGRLTTALGSNWTVYNRAVAGDSTALMLARFKRDVLDKRPTVCLISAGLYNEGFIGSGSKSTVMNTFIANIFYMVLLCRQNNIQPIVTTPYVNDGFIAGDNAYLMRAWYRLEELGCPVIDFYNGLDNGSDNFVPAYEFDALHPNDAGHAVLFHSIPLGIFENAAFGPRNDNRPESGEWQFSGAGATEPLNYAADGDMDSYTVGFFASTASASTSMWGVNELTTFLRVRTVDGDTAAKFALSDTNTGTEVKSNVAVAAGYHHHCVKHNFTEGKVHYFFDGVSKGSMTYVPSTPPNQMTFGARYLGGGPNAGFYKGITIHRSPLPAAMIAYLAKGFVPKASLEGHWPLGGPFLSLNSYARNLAPTNAKMLVKVSDVAVGASGLVVLANTGG